METYEMLVDALIEEGYLTDPAIIDAFRNTPRKPFLKETYKKLEGLNSPLPIGEGQTISQPATVAFIMHMLRPEPGHNVLEIGYGSGWQTALLAHIVCSGKDPGEIYTYEVTPSLAKFGKKNLANFLRNELHEHVHLHQEDFIKSSDEHAPYDRITSAAGFTETPTMLIKQLKTGGIIVFPTMADDIRRIIRKFEDKYTEEVFPGFAFNPVIH